jgi:hypothetical protein
MNRASVNRVSVNRASIRASSTVPAWLGRLTGTERRVWDAFRYGELVDLRTGDPEADHPAGAEQWSAERTVRGEVIAALLLGAHPPISGAVAAVRLAGARITGELSMDHGQVCSLLLLRGCRFDGPIDLDDAVTESIDLSGSQLTTLSAYGAQVRGTLDLRDTVVTGDGDRAVHADGIRIDGSLFAGRAKVNGSFCLINAQIGGQATFVDAKLTNRAPGGTSLNAGGMRLGRSLLARRLHTEGELRLPGAHIGSSLVLNGARLDGLGRPALYADALSVAGEASFRPHRDEPFTATGSVRLVGARFGGDLYLSGAQLTVDDGQRALHGGRMTIAGSVYLNAGFHTDGEIRLTGCRITGHLDLHGMASPDARLTLFAANAASGINDALTDWPGKVNLDGFTYGPFANYAEATKRVALLKRQVDRHHLAGNFRAQPYEQLAAYYRSLGQDGEARTVLLAKERALRAVLPWPRRIPRYLLDALVGYGYRPLRAFGWAVGLLAASSMYFSQVRPQHISSEDTSVFNPVLYAADHLIPVIRFGQNEAWQYHGIPAVVTVILTVLGWTLGIAIAAAAARTFNRN